MNLLDHLVGAGLVQRNVRLDAQTTYKLGGPARYYAEVDDEEQLMTVAQAAAEHDILVLGRGSNLVISDQGYPGVIVKLGAEFSWVEFTEGEVGAGAARSMPSLARSCARQERGGLEFLVGIPGSVGGGVRMNAGCHGSEIADRLTWARVVEMRSGEVAELKPDDLAMSYRDTNLSPDQVVTAAWLRTDREPRRVIEDRMREIVRWRRAHQPGGTLNAGSVFKNPPGDSAGRLIDSLGLKGLRVGGASVSRKHANFFVADRHATAQNVFDLVAAVRERVAEETGIRLEPELQFAGPFRGEE